MKVKNLHGSSALFGQPTCQCSTWIEHWINNKGVKPIFCRCCGKQTTDLVGGHVIKVSGEDKSRYIVPLCRDCNNTNNEAEFDVSESDLVSANCDKCKNKKVH